MSEGRPRDSYPFWVAMGAAFVGTLLGGGAVWIGVRERLERTEAPALGASVDGSSAGALAAATGPAGELRPSAEPSGDAGELRDAGEIDPGDSPLVRAVAQTRDAVVSVAVAGQVRGAGVVYDEAGALLTNYHVIEPVLRARAVLPTGLQAELQADGNEGLLTARFPDGRERAARIIAADPDEDVAILSLVREREAERFAAVALGRSAALRLGEQVFAIGSPVGFEGTVATGIVSSLHRTGVLANRSLAVIQLDAAINFGSSGGPLFNLAGELVGITTARSSRGEGIGFAIPIDRVRLFLRALYEGKQGRSGMIGVALDPRVAIADAIAALGYHSGVAVAAIDPEGPAAKAGMREGDVIVTVRGRRHDQLDTSLLGRSEFAELVGETIRGLIPGETLAVEVVRGDAVVPLELTVTAASPAQQASIDAERLLGLRLLPGGDGASDASSDGQTDGQGLTIGELVRGSPIALTRGAELLIGAEIVSLFGEPIQDRAELGERLASLRTWAASGGRRTIAIGFELADGRRVAASNYPLR